MSTLLNRITAPLRAMGRAAVFFLKVFPMLPSGPVDWVTPASLVEKVKYPTSSGEAQGEIYRPPSPGPHPGILVCLGVVPFGVDHPQVPVLGKALARAGIAALLYWSPAMRDFRLDPEDIENIALAYNWFIGQPFVDPARSGLLGTCVGGSFALMAGAHALIRNQVSFIAAYAPFSSMLTLAPDIATGTCDPGDGRRPWKVDQLTRRVFVHSVTASLEGSEAERLRRAFAVEGGQFDGQPLSAGGKAVYRLITAADIDHAGEALQALPAAMQQRLALLSPVNYLRDIRAPLIVHLHDRGDQVVPVGESRRLHASLDGRSGVNYTEMQFSHLDPVKGRLPFPQLLGQLGRFLGAVYPLFRQMVKQ